MSKNSADLPTAGTQSAANVGAGGRNHPRPLTKPRTPSNVAQLACHLFQAGQASPPDCCIFRDLGRYQGEVQRFWVYEGCKARFLQDEQEADVSVKLTWQMSLMCREWRRPNPTHCSALAELLTRRCSCFCWCDGQDCPGQHNAQATAMSQGSIGQAHAWCASFVDKKGAQILLPRCWRLPRTSLEHFALRVLLTCTPVR